MAMARFHVDEKVRGRLTGRICTIKKIHDLDCCPDALTLVDEEGHMFVDSRRQYSRIRRNFF